MYMGKSKTLRPSCELFSTLEVTFMNTVWKGDGGKNTSWIPPELFLTPAVTVVWRILYDREQTKRLLMWVLSLNVGLNVGKHNLLLSF